MQSRIQKGMIAGLVATAVVSIVDLVASFVQGAMGERVFHSFQSLLSAMAGQVLGSGFNSSWIGWAMHFAAGIFVLGPLFAVLCPRLPTDTAATKGIFFAVGAWLVMCLTVMPLAGMGMFGAAAGFGTIAWMLVSHIIFGVALGRTYARLHGEIGHRKPLKAMAA